MGRIDKFEQNTIINGNFDLWQRGLSFPASVNYGADRWLTSQSGTVVTAEQVAGGPNSKSSFFHRQRITTASAVNGRFTELVYKVEGYDWVQSIGRNIYIQFYAKASVAGFYGLGFAFGGGEPTRYVDEFEIKQADTWELIKVLVPTVPDISGWNITNGTGVRLNISAALGSDFNTAGPIGQWSPVHTFLGTPNIAANTWGDTIGHTFDVSQVMMFTVDENFRIDAIGAQGIPFRRAGKTFADEFSMAQRYYQTCRCEEFRAYVGAALQRHATGSSFLTTMRSTPTPSWVSDNFTNIRSSSQAFAGVSVIDTHNYRYFTESAAAGIMSARIQGTFDAEL